MQTALVVFNPIAGMRWRRRDSELHALLAALTRAGVKTLTTTTRGPHQPPAELFDGLDEFDTVLAVGGDGTVNEVLQAMMVNGQDAALGVVPFGSGNLLAKDLGFHRKVEDLVEALTDSTPQPCPVGCIEQPGTGARRYWLAAAGVGADARVICALSPSAKARFGIAAYYAESTRQLLFSAEPFPLFAVDFQDLAGGRARTEVVAQVVAERIGYFGDFLEAPDAPPLPPDQFRVVLFKTARRSTFLHYGLRLLASQARGHAAYTSLKDVEVVRTREVFCHRADPAGVATQLVFGSQKSLAEVDGELFGELPVRLSLVPRQVRILRPPPK
ncbi:MAG TPA: diacylglycerol kinase family protein [Terriglobales bacterium]|nr:diacylglycerol kinase family protein [Terriglobales bacterium]